MATSTTQSIWRSGGGDTTKTAYAGSMSMVADFYLDPAGAQTDFAQKSDTDTAKVILPAGAIITEIQYDGAATGGTTPTFEMGWIGYEDSSSLDVDGLIDTQASDGGKKSFNWGTSGAGNDLGVVMDADQMVALTGGGTTGDLATGGTITGRVIYYVPTDGSYTA